MSSEEVIPLELASVAWHNYYRGSCFLDVEAVGPIPTLIRHDTTTPLEMYADLQTSALHYRANQSTLFHNDKILPRSEFPISTFGSPTMVDTIGFHSQYVS